MKRLPELRDAFIMRRACLIDAKYCVFVAVECDWLTVLEQISLRDVHVLERGLGVAEMHANQLAGGIVDEHQKCTRRRAALEPAVFGSVDLNQLAEAWSSKPRLMNLGLALGPRAPNASLDHELPDGLLGNVDPVPLKQLLGRQGRPKIRIMGTDQGDDGSTKFI